MLHRAVAAQPIVTLYIETQLDKLILTKCHLEKTLEKKEEVRKKLCIVLNTLFSVVYTYLLILNTKRKHSSKYLKVHKGKRTKRS